MTSTIRATGSARSQNPSVPQSGHGCINMMSTVHVMTHSSDYGLLQLTMGKDNLPPEIPLHIYKLET